MHSPAKWTLFRWAVFAVLIAACFSDGVAQQALPQHGKRAKKLLILNAMKVDGVGTPAEGPVDIVIEGNRITRISPSDPDGLYRLDADGVIDATNQYVLPGFINMHSHLQNSAAGIEMPYEYQHALWLSAGITTARDLGSNFDEAKVEKRKSASGEIAAPRLFLYPFFTGEMAEEEIRNRVRNFKQAGADGIKCWGIDRETFLVVADEANKLGLKIAHHVGVEDANANDDAAVGTTSIEHWYGIPDAALDGVQSFPSDFNHANELHRFRYAGRLWREANPEKLQQVLHMLVDSGVAWDPTLCIYEASRDLQRAITQPWFEAFLHPALEKFFTPNPEYHGSFFFGWTNSDEVYWKENYKIWMKAVRDFANMGGIVTTGEDAGFIYQLYGFGYLRELQLHEEAGFHPLEVIQHATHNGAKVLGMEKELGRVKRGYLADLVVVNGNPLENLQILLPRGINKTLDLQHGAQGGISWTIKDGIPYDTSILLNSAKEIVQAARAKTRP